MAHNISFILIYQSIPIFFFRKVQLQLNIIFSVWVKLPTIIFLLNLPNRSALCFELMVEAHGLCFCTSAIIFLSCLHHIIIENILRVCRLLLIVLELLENMLTFCLISTSKLIHFDDVVELNSSFESRNIALKLLFLPSCFHF